MPQGLLLYILNWETYYDNPSDFVIKSFLKRSRVCFSVSKLLVLDDEISITMSKFANMGVLTGYQYHIESIINYGKRNASVNIRTH